jgi:hypothetical protein
MHNKGIFFRRWVAIAAALVVLAGGPLCGRAENVEQKDVEVAVVRDPQLGAQMAMAARSTPPVRRSTSQTGRNGLSDDDVCR